MSWQRWQPRYGDAAVRATIGRPGRSTDQSPATWQVWELALVAVAIAAQLSLVWGFEFFPSVDGPAHVHLAHGLYEALRGDEFYGSLVEINSKISPNIATQAVLVGLMAIASPFVAEKIWLSLYFVCFAAAGVYALSGIKRTALCLLPLLMLCSMSFSLAFGFYNFSFSVVVFLAWFGYWWRHRHTLGIGVLLGHALFAAVAYFTHIYAFIVTLLGIGTAALAAILLQVLREWSVGTPRAETWRRSLLCHAVPPLLGSIPELIACLNFLFFRFGASTAAGAAKLAPAEPERLIQLLTATSLAPYDRMELVPAVAFVLTILILLFMFLRHGKHVKDSIPLAACFAGFLALHLIMPHQWIVRWMPARFQPMVFIALLLWLAALLPAAARRSHRQMIGIAGLLVVLASTAAKTEIFARIDDYYREYASAAPHIAENSTLIGLRLHTEMDGRPFPDKVSVLIQASSRIASARHSVDLKNFQGQSSDHPIQFRPGIAATAALGGNTAITARPPQVNLMAYERQTGRLIDYVLLYGFRHAVEDKEALARLDAQLRESYKLIYVSEPRGFVHLYLRSSATRPADANERR
jgi:hypothetical protein